MLARAPSSQTHLAFAAARDLLLGFARESGRGGLAALFYVFASALLEGAGVSLLVPFLAIIVGAPVQGRLGYGAAMLFRLLHAGTPSARLLLLLAVFGLVMVLRAVVLAVRDLTLARLQFGFIEAQRLRIIRRLADARWDRIAHLRHARIAHVMSGDVQRLGIGINAFLVGAVAAVMLAAQCLLAILLAPAAGCLIMALLALALATAGPALAAARRVGGDVAAANLSLLDSSVQFLGGLKMAISQNLQGPFVAETARALTHLVERQNSHVRQQTWARATITILSALAGGGLVLAGFDWLHVAPAVLMTLLVIVSRMMAPLAQIQQGIQQLAHTLAIHDEISGLETELAQAAADAPHHSATAPMGDIVFEQVSYSHVPGRRDGSGVRELDLTIGDGEFLAVTGASGSGKTSFADLLAGLYPPQSGCIRVGGVVLDGMVLPAWRGSLSYVAQDPFLFHDSIRRNLAWANPQAGEAQIWQALNLAGADALVRGMAQGLDTTAGERGMLVSGGERQRIALARALLRRPRLLILDEATGAIDSAGEREIFLKLRTLGITIVAIAHRGDNLHLCDRVLDWDAICAASAR